MSDTTDDTTGHVLHGDAAEHPVTGGQAPGLVRAQAAGEDDTEGHLARAATGDEPGRRHRGPPARLSATRRTSPRTTPRATSRAF